MFAFCLGSLLSVCSFADRPNIVWINAEDMSPHLGCYGHPDADTPIIDAIAKEGIVYRNAFATAPICSPARSCLATGLYATSMGTQHLRCEIQIPARVVPLAKRLQQHGYFCTNTGKSDYNFSPDGIWDAWSNDVAPWRGRQRGQPFFGFITVGETHEGRINFIDRYQQATAQLPDDRKHDPDAVFIPPFYPDSAEIRRIFARMHDLATVFDLKVGEVVETLKKDGDWENTILFVFGDHGNGLPRYKRWLNDSGLRVPLVIHVPEKYRHLVPESDRIDAEGSSRQRLSNRLVSFVDFPATALRMAGVEVPRLLQGTPFLGAQTLAARKYVYGARSRADDMFEVSRSVFDGQFLYVRHFLPHVPYVQRSVIFDDRKSAFRELRRLHLKGDLDEHAARMWVDRKPVEELYDLDADPHELSNLAESEYHQEVKERLQQVLVRWILSHRDSGFLPESEYQRRAMASGTTPMDVVHDPSFDLTAVVDTAWMVGDPNVSPDDLAIGLEHQEAGVRYWSAIGLLAHPGELTTRAREGLERCLNDDSPSVRISAAEALVTKGGSTLMAEKELSELVEHQQIWVALEAASCLARLGPRAKPLVDAMKRTIEKNRSEPGSRRPYKDFNYASFTGWALEAALLACGEEDYVAAINQ